MYGGNGGHEKKIFWILILVYRKVYFLNISRVSSNIDQFQRLLVFDPKWSVVKCRCVKLKWEKLKCWQV